MLQDEKEYLKLLKVIGNNQKYDFYSQLSIYNKEPEARDCATFDMWKKYFGRVVMRGQKGIPILVGSDINQRISYIFDISQTTSMDRNINEVSLWQFDHENHNEALKEIINASSFEASDSLNENIFSLSRIYGDKNIHLALTDLRIDIEDRLSFEKFMRDSISYAVANRFNTVYPLDIENINEDRGGQNDLYRRVDRSRSRDGRVFTDGSDRGNSDEAQRENLGYESKYQILNAMDFGIPQKKGEEYMFPILICEDDSRQLEQITQIIKQYCAIYQGRFEIALATSNSAELLEYINEYNIQGGTYYLDIDLGQEMNGIDLADKIRTIDVTGKFTFITTHEEMAPLTLKRKIETFDFIAKHSNDYLKKQLMTNLELVYNRFIQQQKRKAITVVRFKVGNICYKLPIDDVVYMTTSDKPHRLTLYTKRGKHEFYGKISDYEEECLELTKVSQSTLVNFDYVDMFRVDKRMIVFTNGLYVECSKRYVMEIKNKMQGINI